MPRIEFEADTEQELVNLAWRWVMGPKHEREGGSEEGGADETELRRRHLLSMHRYRHARSKSGRQHERG